MSCVSSVGFRRVPRQYVLFLLRKSKEFRRVSKNVVNFGRWDAMVFKVQKTGVLEAREDGRCSFFLFGRISVEEEGEVY